MTEQPEMSYAGAPIIERMMTPEEAAQHAKDELNAAVARLLAGDLAAAADAEHG